jgi:hypothetical protein
VTRELAKVRTARRGLEKVRGRLLRPSIESLDACAADLNTAVESLRELERDLPPPDVRPLGYGALAVEIRSMRNEAQQAEALLQAAGQFYAGWAQLLVSGADSGPANYSARGKSESPVSIDRGRVVVHG